MDNSINSFVKLNGLYVNKNAKEAISLYNRLKIKNHPKRFPIFLNGSGYIHYKTYDILKKEEIQRYVHFDAHTDSVKKYKDGITYLNFVEHIKDLNSIRQILLIGTRYKDILDPKIYQFISNESNLPEKDVLLTHMSIDLDVLKDIGIVEKVWENDGTLSLQELINYLNLCKERYNIRSADICGIARIFPEPSFSLNNLLNKPSELKERELMLEERLKNGVEMVEEIITCLSN